MQKIILDMSAPNYEVGPLVVLSNRLPFILKRDDAGNLVRKASAGGLVTAVAPVVVRCKGCWVGWPGIHLQDLSEPIPESDSNDNTPTAGLLSKQVVPVNIEREMFNQYYNGCCNGAFWPLFHSMPDRAVFLAENWKAYSQVNQFFANRAIDALKALDQTSQIPLVWIHDYHLMLAANTVRQGAEEANLPCKLGFFLHIPFPPWDIFRLFPWDDEVLQGVLGKSVNQSSTKVILGVDRLDYTKGLVHRLKAFERLLEVHPEHIEKVTLLQIAVPSRTDVKEYQDLKEEVDQLVGHINGRFTTPNWSPIRYIYGCVGQEELAAFYRDAAVALVTPLRDGMNLVAKEFVACRVKDPGVLIVSPFAGAGETMLEALVVNPYEINDAASVLHRALTMPEDERQVRMHHLRRRERLNDVNHWMHSFLKAMGSIVNGDEVIQSTMLPMTAEDFEYLASYIGEYSRLALLLDYDGTLAPIAPHPDLAVLPAETKRVLEKLVNTPDIYVAIVSGRNVNNVKNMVGIEGITYAGNHGLEIIHPDGTKFVHPMPTEFEGKVRNLLKALQEEVCHDGAWVENKGALLTFHYRETPVPLRAELAEKARKLMIENGFSAGKAHCALEARPPVQWDKGRASIYILRTAFGVDWSERVKVIYAGDDVTDEDAMRALKGMAATFLVTVSPSVRTAADRRLPSTDAIIALLKWVENYMSSRSLRKGVVPGNVKLEVSFVSEPQEVSNK
ncbi:hypothetical protein J437_LFUL012953 [Ladona fulva]|uniref:Trehalose-6-phosphate synthase n=1 Tax=Ladona fulva TaxID=123851 RepID=A0A8K0KCR1_LADFU|nr:hypothetical protein J437_LFUL012953 [Ladona fulva]